MAILSLSDYKKLRDVDGTNRDDALNIAIPAAEDLVCRYTDRDFTSAPVTEARDYPYNGSGLIQVDDFTNLTAITINARALDSEGYRVAPAGAGPYCTIELAGGLPSPLMGFERNLDTLSGRRERFVTASVTATWGWPTGQVPPSVQIAVAILTDELAPAAEDGDESGYASKSIADYSVAFDNPQSTNEAPTLPPLVATLLDNFRRIRF